MKIIASLFSIQSLFLLGSICLLSVTNSDKKLEEPSNSIAPKNGIKVTIALGIPELITDLANDPRVSSFKVPHSFALDRMSMNEGNFIDLFVEEFEIFNDSTSLIKHFFYYDRNGITRESTNTEVHKWLKGKAEDALNETGRMMVKRALNYQLPKPKIKYNYESNQLTIELPGIVDNAFVRKCIKANSKLRFYEVYENKMNGIAGLVLQAESQLSDTFYGIEINSRNSGNGEPDSLLSQQDRTKKYPISSLLNLAFAFDETGSIYDYQEGSIIGYAKIKDTSALTALLNHPKMRKNLPQDLEFMWDFKEIIANGQRTGTVAVHAIKVPINGPKVDNKDVQRAALDDITAGQFGVNLKMNKIGATKWEQMTTNNLDKQIAIVVNNAVISAPVVMGVMSESSSITGNFTEEEANDLVKLINAGSLPTPVYIVNIDKL